MCIYIYIHICDSSVLCYMIYITIISCIIIVITIITNTH